MLVKRWQCCEIVAERRVLYAVVYEIPVFCRDRRNFSHSNRLKSCNLRCLAEFCNDFVAPASPLLLRLRIVFFVKDGVFMTENAAKLPEIIIICGPTASGKSGLAVRLAEKIGGEIISADSMQIYRKFSIGTAKPTAEEMQRVPHHLVDFVDPADSFSVKDYERAALSAIAGVKSRGKMPILCGGTGFYVESVLYSMTYGGTGEGGASVVVREKYKKLAESEGNETVYRILQKIDPVSAEKLHPNDLVRVIRALEIYETTGKRKSEQHDERWSRFSYAAFMPDFPREKLYDRINRRVDEMFAAGWEEEVKTLMKEGVPASSQAMTAIGYREIVADLLNFGSLHSTTLDIIKQNTRNYAKRQVTFFKRLPGLVHLDAESGAESMAKEICRRLGL